MSARPQLDSVSPPPDSPLLGLLGLARRARHAQGTAELAFLAVNDSHALAPYRQAALWFRAEGVRALSGVVQAEANVPYVQWLSRLCSHLAAQDAPARMVIAADAPPDIRDGWAEWLPAYVLCVPLAGTDGILLFARDVPWTEHEIAVMAEWADTWRHAWLARHPAPQWTLRSVPQRVARQLKMQPGVPWWKQRANRWAAAALVVVFFPVRLSVLAPGELVPCHAADSATQPLSVLAGKRVRVIVSIGDPAAFIAQLTSLGADVRASVFPDHHDFTGAEVDAVARDAAGADLVICTLKDAVKLGPLWPRLAPLLWYVSQRVTVERGVGGIEHLLDDLVRARFATSQNAG